MPDICRVRRTAHTAEARAQHACVPPFDPRAQVRLIEAQTDWPTLRIRAFLALQADGFGRQRAKALAASA